MDAAAPADPLDAALARFEAVADASDPHQQRLLHEMREHTRRLHQARGDWERPGDERSWNSAAPRGEARPPLADEAYRWGAAAGAPLHAPSHPPSSLPGTLVMRRVLSSLTRSAYKEQVAKEARRQQPQLGAPPPRLLLTHKGQEQHAPATAEPAGAQ